jgi:hypothetical protein
VAALGAVLPNSGGRGLLFDPCDQQLHVVASLVAQPTRLRSVASSRAPLLRAPLTGPGAHRGYRTRPIGEPHQPLNDQREAIGQAIAGAAVEPHLVAVLAGDDAEAIVLDLMEPCVPGWGGAAFWSGDTAGRSQAGGAWAGLSGVDAGRVNGGGRL